MPRFIVTIKLPKNPNHDPRNKQTGPCPVTNQPCDDVTGEHHSFLVDAPTGSTVYDVRSTFAMANHVTRVEMVR